MNNNDFDDDLSDLLGGKRQAAAPKQPPAHYVPLEKRFEEGCPKCGGTGKFRSYSGRIIGDCFNCQGSGKKIFKTSPEARAQTKDRKENKARELLAEVLAWQEQHAAAWQWMTTNNARGNKFAQSLCEALNKYGALTDNQLAAVERNVAKAAESQAEREAAAPTVDATKIEKAFAIAREKATRKGMMGTFEKPLKLTSPDKITMVFRPGSIGSQWEGMLFAKSEDGKKLGSIKNGKFFRRFECTDVEEAAVIAVASDPETAVVAYAKAFSRCGVCGKQLLNDVSIARGIGPICAGKFGW